MSLLRPNALLCVSDLKSDLMKKDEVFNLTVSPHQSLLLRCRFDESKKLYPVWERDGEKLDAQTLRCSSTVDKEVWKSSTDTTECKKN